jgi:dimethylamine/trimethylamine dehydrogenase
MECALVLARRGFRRVHLVDENPEPGGHFRWATRLPGLGEWARVVNWRRIQLANQRNVELVLDTRLEAEDVLDYGAEIVILATGARWATNGLNGITHQPIPGCEHEQPHVLTPEQLLQDGKQPPGPRVLVWDCEGYYTATTLAEQLATSGHTVTLTTPHETLAPLHAETLEAPLVRARLHQIGVTTHTGLTLKAVEPGQATLTDDYGQTHTHQTDCVLLVSQRLSDTSLYNQLSRDPQTLHDAGIRQLHRTGDCLAPRLPADTIYDAHRLAREIHTPNPDQPLPYKRERAILAAPSR